MGLCCGATKTTLALYLLSYIKCDASLIHHCFKSIALKCIVLYIMTSAHSSGDYFDTQRTVCQVETRKKRSRGGTGKWGEFHHLKQGTSMVFRIIIVEEKWKT